MNAKPNINVTPLIDVLLVLLIIFMVITPPKPTDFKTKIPSDLKSNGAPNPRTLIVTLNPDSTLRLNAETKFGTVGEPGKLIEKLAAVFRERAENGAYREGADFKPDLPEDERIERTVFIKAPRSIDYGSVVRVIDAVKIAGATPISLQIDELE